MRRPPTLRPLLAALLLWIPAAGCGQGGEAPETAAPGTVERELFVAAYVDLREAALLHGGELPDSLRAAVLARHGVTGDDLLRFAEVHGDEVRYMDEVWSEIEARLEARRVPLDSLRTDEP